MNSRPRTIQIFLPDGSANGIKVAEFTSKVVKAIQVPKARLKDFAKRPEANLPGVYFLFGDSDQTAEPKVYIGETENCHKRLGQHLKKDFWFDAVVVVSKTETLTKSHIKFLEHHCVEQAEKAGKYEVENSSKPTKSHLTETMEADVMDLFDDMKILLSTLGFPAFELLEEEKKKAPVLTCRGKKALAKGQYVNNGFLVLEGSVANKEETPTIPKGTVELRRKLLALGKLSEEGEVLKFIKEHHFKSPSTAAGVVLGRSTNGWTQWKDDEGKTLHELERQ